jgi:predicted nucleic acid-binding protein
MGKIDSLLERIQGQRAYIDTNIFIYFLARHEIYFEASARILSAFDKSEAIGVTGDVTLAEILVKPYREGDNDAVAAIKRFFARENFISLTPHSLETFDLAAELRGRRGGKLIDALHYATAIQAGCSIFLSNDHGFTSSEGLEALKLNDFLE